MRIQGSGKSRGAVAVVLGQDTRGLSRSVNDREVKRQGAPLSARLYDGGERREAALVHEIIVPAITHVVPAAVR